MRLGILKSIITLAVTPTKLLLPTCVNTPLVARIHAQVTPSICPVLCAKSTRCKGWKYKKPKDRHKAGKEFDQMRKCFGFKPGNCPCDGDVIRPPRCREKNKPLTRKQIIACRDNKRFWKAVKRQDKQWSDVEYNRRWDH